MLSSSHNKSGGVVTATSTPIMPIDTLLRLQPKLCQPESIETLIMMKQKAVLDPVEETEPLKPRRSVQFKEKVSVRPITHVNDMDDDEIADVWYNKNDFARMKRSIAVTLKMLKMSNGVYARGLEHKITKAANLRRRANKMYALNAVLDEQDRQRSRGMINTEGLRHVFVMENLACRLAALQMGIQDEEDARKLDKEEEEKQ